jgi:hypothetical protein
MSSALSSSSLKTGIVIDEILGPAARPGFAASQRMSVRFVHAIQTIRKLYAEPPRGILKNGGES